MINKDWKTVLKRYSFLAHLAVAISSVGLIAIMPFIGYVPMPVALSVTLVLSLIGIAGSFIKQTNQESKNDKCQH